MRGLHHVAVFTADYGATAGFYRETFGAKAPTEPLQPSVVDLGGAVLHVFERQGTGADWSPTHLHHFALQAGDLAEFVAIRDRLLARGACDSRVIDFGEHLSVLATDPDGGMVELLVETADRIDLPFAVVSHESVQ
jgi:catechol 2,3-dioxygenase-like lactoylglutathione lyase family enzyme